MTSRLIWINHFALPPEEGGGTRHFDTAREMIGRDWDVSIVAADFHYASRRYTRRPDAADTRALSERIDGVGFHWLWSAPYETNDWRRGWNWLSFARSLLRWQKTADRPELVIGSSPHLFAALAGLRVARRWNVPFVFEVRDLWPESLIAAGGRKGPVYHTFDRIARYLYGSADRIVCLARGTARYLEEERGVDPEKFVFVPNGVDPDALPVIEREGRDSFTLLYAGAHGPANGLDVVLDAAERLRGHPDIRFLLVGDGPEKNELLRSVSERGLSNVEFRDPVPKSSMPELLAEADAGLMVLRDTPLFAFGVSPNKLFDYFGAAMPVVCNVPGEVAGMVREAGAGEQAEAGSEKALADAILRLAARPEDERAAMGRSAREWVVREHGRPVLADRLDAALRELLTA